MSRSDPTSRQRVLVLGGQGVLGAMVANVFREAGWTAVRAGRRAEAAQDFRLVDLADPGSLGAALDSSELVVNTVPDAELSAERMVLDRGGLLVNVSALPAAAVRRLRDEHPAPRGTVLMNAGIAPGVTNLVAADLLGEHPEAEQVELVFTVSGRSCVGPAGAEFAHRGLTGHGHHRTTVIPLPTPFGRRRCLGFAEKEKGWLDPSTLGPRSVDTYVCLGERGRQRGLLALNAARLVSLVPRSAFVTGRIEATSEPVAHWIAVRRDDHLLAARSVRCSGDYRAAAASTLVLASALRARDPQLPAGVLVPEQVLTLRDVREDLRRAGIGVVDENQRCRTPA